MLNGNKNDFIDAQAIIEAALRPDTRTVAVKPVEPQSQAVIHRLREGFVAERAACMSIKSGTYHSASTAWAISFFAPDLSMSESGSSVSFCS